MKNNKLIYVLMSFLSFSILFGGIYFVITKETILGIALIVLSLISIITIYFLLRKKNQEESNFYSLEDDQEYDQEYNQEHYKKLAPKGKEIKNKDGGVFEKEIAFEEITIPLDDEIDEFNIDHYDDLDEEISEAFQETVFTDEDEIEKPTAHMIDVVVKEEFEENLESFMSTMINHNMFLETYEYRYNLEQILKYNLEGKNLYKYEFHPIPLVSLVRDSNNNNIIKVMIGINKKNIQHIGYVSPADTRFVNTNYRKIKNIKAGLTGGTYRFLEKDANIIRQNIEPFVIKLRIYL